MPSFHSSLDVFNNAQFVPEECGAMWITRCYVCYTPRHSYSEKTAVFLSLFIVEVCWQLFQKKLLTPAFRCHRIFSWINISSLFWSKFQFFSSEIIILTLDDKFIIRGKSFTENFAVISFYIYIIGCSRYTDCFSLIFKIWTICNFGNDSSKWRPYLRWTWKFYIST